MSKLEDDFIKLQNNMPLDKEVLEIDGYKIVRLTINDIESYVKVLEYPKIRNEHAHNISVYDFGVLKPLPAPVTYTGGTYKTIRWESKLAEICDIFNERHDIDSIRYVQNTTVKIEYCTAYNKSTDTFTVDESRNIILHGVYVEQAAPQITTNDCFEPLVEFRLGCQYITYNMTPTETLEPCGINKVVKEEKPVTNEVNEFNLDMLI